MSEILRLAEFAGVNLADHPRDLADNEFAWAENIYPLSPSTLALRKGSNRMDEWSLGEWNFGGRVERPISIGGYVHSNGARYVYAWAFDENDGNVQIRAFDRDTVSWSGALAQLFAQFLEFNPSWAIWRDRFYTLRPSIGSVVALNGKTLESDTVLTVGGVTIFPRLMAVYRDRMLYAGDPADPNILYVSDVNVPETITAGQFIRVGRGDGGKLTAIVVVGTTGGDVPAESQILLLKERQTWLFRGALTPTTVAAGQDTLHLVSREAGCVNHRTVAVTPQGVIWAGYDNVYLMPSLGAVPIEVGKAVKDLLRQISTSAYHRMRAVYYDGFYRLMYDSGESTRGSYQVWADMRTPGKITWWGPMTTQWLADFYVDHIPLVKSRLLAMTPASSGTTQGRVYVLDAAQHYEQMMSDANPSNPERGIVLPVLRTKEYDFGDPNRRKIIEAAELNFWSDRTRELTVTFRGDTQRTRAVTYNAGGWTLGNTLPSGALTALHSQMNFSAQVSGRTVSRTLQLQIEATSLGSETDVGPFQIQEIVTRLRRIQRRVA